MAKLRLPRALQSAVALCRGMARAGRRPDHAAGPRSAASLRRRGARGGIGRALETRRGLAGNCLVALALFLGFASAQAQVVSTRIWPSKEYTRVTLESKTEI